MLVKDIKNIKDYLQFLYDRGDLDIMDLDQGLNGALDVYVVIYNTWRGIKPYEFKLQKIRRKLLKRIRKLHGGIEDDDC